MEYIDQAEESRRCRELYAHRSDFELQTLAEKLSDLTEFAQQALRAEFSKRDLQMQAQAALAREILPDEDELVNCYRARDSSAARLVMDILDSSGIPSCLFGDFGENLQRLYPVHDTGGIIRVLKRDAERARELIAPYFPQEQGRTRITKSAAQGVIPLTSSFRVLRREPPNAPSAPPNSIGAAAPAVINGRTTGSSKIPDRGLVVQRGGASKCSATCSVGPRFVHLKMKSRGSQEQVALPCMRYELFEKRLEPRGQLQLSTRRDRSQNNMTAGIAAAQAIVPRIQGLPAQPRCFTNPYMAGQAQIVVIHRAGLGISACKA